MSNDHEQNKGKLINEGSAFGRNVIHDEYPKEQENMEKFCFKKFFYYCRRTRRIGLSFPFFKPIDLFLDEDLFQVFSCRCFSGC
ncbi:Uncharacterized protein TCM_042256 [Theobroma cacao]|uniref:Uncharacterized protein n=1 Tax=Theobroma cacao TaxID=3641 RepID=A0A061GZ68_THECC|nr:Uncharacterized protein TCM_042256 [Theobroma cacao]